MCVAVQEEVAFSYAYQLRNILMKVAIVEIIVILLYIIWNVLLTIYAAQNEEKAKRLEYEKMKNEARSKFISNMSHDLKTPLNGIVGMLQIIENHRSDEKKVDDCLKKIAISTKYLSTLASDMLDINIIENDKLILHKAPIDLKKLVEELEVMLKKRAEEEGVEYHIDLSELKYQYVVGSEVHLKRILINLVTNAIKYSKNAGKNVWINISDEENSLDEAKRVYRFVVKDNGIGMSKKFQQSMYTAFEQEKISARSDYQGYGLGLTIVNALVKKMDGKIELDSEQGVGSTFTVSIPLSMDESGVRPKQDVIENVSLDGREHRVFSKKVQDNWYVVMLVNIHDLFRRVEMNLVVNIILSLGIFGIVWYFCKNSHKNRLVAMIYAGELEEYKATLEERVNEQTEEIRIQAARMIEMQKTAVEGMASLIESRDGNTGEHVRNTRTYVSLILKYMYENKLHKDVINKNYVRKVESAATLHDVGKIKISDVILNKPGKFTPEEYEVMKTHAPLGGEIVKEILGKNADVELVEIASDVARYHHEKWDGTGYPEGLKGKEIPLSARIMAVADVFDALVSKRVYKEAMSVDKAINILKEEAGTHFDPEIVEVFIKIRAKVEEHLIEINA